MAITLRTLADSDLDTLFVWESYPRAIQMAAFTRADPSDRTAFDAHYERIRNDPSCTLRAIDDDGELIDDDGEFVGTVGSFTMEGEREVTYWIAPARWGQGLASRALRAFLAIEPTRPLYGRVAHHNGASAKVLARADFVEVGRETSFARGVGAEIVELIYRLDH
jgi:RimJ/RimL family protein N-acetyltransferase